MISPGSHLRGSNEKEGGGEAYPIKQQKLEGPWINHSPQKKGEFL